MLSPEFFVEALILRGELATVCNPFRRSTYTVSSIQNEKSDPFPIGKGSDYLNLVEEGGFEPPKRNVTDLQSAPFGHSGTPPYYLLSQTDAAVCPIQLNAEAWSWWTDSNPRPADYKSAALPTELHQRFRN